MMLPITDDVARRRPIWEALANLFLDTETSLDREWRAAILAGSSYSMHELEQILVLEVSPACRVNLASVAGAWSGFDMDWLQQRILRQAASPLRYFRHLSPGRQPPGAVREEWNATKLRIDALRGVASATVAS